MTGFMKILSRAALLTLAVAQNVDLRIMPLGASITNGVGSSSGNGYRQFLLESLNGAGFPVDYVGSQQSGDMPDRDNEGYPGARIDEVQERAAAAVQASRPNVYAINAGTNDAAQDRDINNAGLRMASLLDSLWAVTPDATVLLSTLIINTDGGVDSRVQVINAQYIGLAADWRAQGRKIVLVDMHGPEGPQPEDMNDPTHPNDTGFAKMAALWFNGIQDANASGFLTAPN
jgi:lysophospholipase L1-like esterase